MTVAAARKDSVRYIEFHYFLNDESHSMNAYVFNKCECEILSILKEIQSKFGFQFDVEIEPIANGGIRSWLKTKNSKATNFDALVLAVVGCILAGLITDVDKLTWNYVEHLLTADPEIELLKKKRDELQLQYEIQELKKKIEPKITSVDQSLIKKRRSNFYSALSSEQKIDSISVSTENAAKDVIASYSVPRKEFGKFILATDVLEPLVDEHAQIEIISPVLKRGKYKWSGLYNNETIHFSMSSKEFKESVQTGRVSFKNGFSIDCRLISCRKVDEEGNAIITKRQVDLVNSYSEEGTPHETTESRNNRLDKKTKMDQLSLWD